ncbi:endonuclease III [Rickettsiales bacterium]|nr:endonuclease III [Rickettsiales bacterium]
MLDKDKILAMCEKFDEVNPDPKIELEYVNNFTLLIAILMSAQSTDKMVNRCTRELFKVCKTPEDALNLGYDQFMEYIRYIGMYRNKTKHVMALCRILLSDHDGEVPNKFEDLIKLPGVGNKTANVFLNSAFGVPTIGVDRHIFRIVHKIGIVNGKNTDEVAENLGKIIPEKYHLKIHHWLVLHGRYICKARKQLCSQCPISEYCESYQMNKKNIMNT